ncbi:MAG: DotI/IcmL/TraM family protein [Alphaproteobacteria bacterium]|nr:DotI/IcmL/TraM family protein [Alphaproteobacteria bacterium]
MRFLLTFLIVFTVLFQAVPVFAAKSVWDVFGSMFEEKPEEPDPSKTLQAPFAYDPDRKINAEEALPENAVPLDISHRSPKEIGDWLMVAVSDAMSFEAMKEGAKPDYKREYFTPAGLHQFEEFLERTGIKKVLDSRKYHLRSFVRQDPLLLNEGAVEGHYRWLYEVPVMVSYIETGNFKYAEKDAINQAITLTVQVTRVKDGGGKEGVLIEIWKGKIESLDKKKTDKK